MSHTNIFLATIVYVFAATACASPVAPIRIGGSAEVDACSALGKVMGLKVTGDGFLAVRSGPKHSFDKIDEIVNEQLVFICDSSYNGNWLGIVYSPSGDDNCGVTSPIEDRHAYSGPCKMGWVNSKWIEVVAG